MSGMSQISNMHMLTVLKCIHGYFVDHMQPWILCTSWHKKVFPKIFLSTHLKFKKYCVLGFSLYIYKAFVGCVADMAETHVNMENWWSQLAALHNYQGCHSHWCEFFWKESCVLLLPTILVLIYLVKNTVYRCYILLSHKDGFN